MAINSLIYMTGTMIKPRMVIRVIYHFVRNTSDMCHMRVIVFGEKTHKHMILETEAVVAGERWREEEVWVETIPPFRLNRKGECKRPILKEVKNE